MNHKRGISLTYSCSNISFCHRRETNTLLLLQSFTIISEMLQHVWIRKQAYPENKVITHMKLNVTPVGYQLIRGNDHLNQLYYAIFPLELKITVMCVVTWKNPAHGGLLILTFSTIYSTEQYRLSKLNVSYLHVSRPHAKWSQKITIKSLML